MSNAFLGLQKSEAIEFVEEALRRQVASFLKDDQVDRYFKKYATAKVEEAIEEARKRRIE